MHLIITFIKNDPLPMNKPFYKIQDYLPTFIYEFNHSYVKPLIDKFSDQIENSGGIIFESAVGNMRRQTYGNWKPILYRQGTRAPS